MKRILLSALLALGLAGTAYAHPTRVPVHSYGVTSGVRWTITQTHLDWQTRARVTERDSWSFPVHRGNPTGYRITRSVSTGGHVITTVRYPTFAVAVLAVSGGCFGAVPAASAATGVSAAILRGIIRVESEGNPSAVSSAGAVGCMQMMPFNWAPYGVSNPYDAYQNVMGGARLFAVYLRQAGGNVYAALESYNGGGYGYASAVLGRAG